MILIPSNKSIILDWTILKRFSTEKEDFSRATAKFLLYNCCKGVMYPFSIVNGAVHAELPNDLEKGVYGVKFVWYKDDNVNKLIYAEKRDLFCINEETDETTGACKIAFQTSTPAYGYDGLSAYEKSVMTGKTTMSEDDWLDQLNMIYNTPQIILNCTTEYVDAAGGDATIIIRKKGIVGSLTAKCYVGEIEMETVGLTFDEEQTQLTVTVPESAASRTITYTINVTDGTTTSSVNVKQAAALVKVLTLKNTTGNVSADGGTATISIAKKNVGTLTASTSEGASYVESLSMNDDQTSLDVTMNANSEYTTRSCAITVTDGEVSKTISIEQEAVEAQKYVGAQRSVIRYVPTSVEDSYPEDAAFRGTLAMIPMTTVPTIGAAVLIAHTIDLFWLLVPTSIASGIKIYSQNNAADIETKSSVCIDNANFTIVSVTGWTISEGDVFRIRRES